MSLTGGIIEERKRKTENIITGETVCQLVLRELVSHISIDVDVEESVQEKKAGTFRTDRGIHFET